MAGEAGVFGHQDFWLLRNHDEDVEWESAGGIFVDELAFGASEIKGAERLMEIKRPTGRADEPGNRNAPAMRAELIAALAATHRVLGTAAVELWAAFAEAQERGIGDEKR